MDKKYLVRTFHYLEGELKLFEAEFELLEEAMEHGLKSLCHSFKILDKEGHVCHDSQGGEGDYA